MARRVLPRVSGSFAKGSRMFAVRVYGEAAIREKFQELKTSRQNAAVRRAMRPVASLLKKSAKREAPKDRGRMRKAIDSKVASVPKNRRAGARRPVVAVVAIVGIKRKQANTSRDAGKLSQTSLGTKQRTTLSGASRGRIVGTGWFKRAHTIAKAACEGMFRRKFAESMLIEVQRVAAKRMAAGK